MKKIKISSCKHSPGARTCVEQATGDIHPHVQNDERGNKKRCQVPTMKTCHSISKSITCSVNWKIPLTNNNGRVSIIILPVHKKNVIIVGLSKLPNYNDKLHLPVL